MDVANRHAGMVHASHGVQVQHAGRPGGVLGVGAGVAHDEQAPMQVVVDGHKQEVHRKDVQALHITMEELSWTMRRRAQCAFRS